MSMKTFLAILCLFINLIVFSQVQVDNCIYMQFDLSKQPIIYKKVLFKTNPPGPYGYYIQKSFASHGILAFDYYSYFPQVRSYTITETHEKLKQLGIEAIMEIIVDISTITKGHNLSSYTTYDYLTNSINTYGYLSNDSKQSFSGSVLVFDYRDWNNPIVVSNGNFTGYRNKSLIVRIVNQTLNGLEKNGLLIKQKKISF